MAAFFHSKQKNKQLTATAIHEKNLYAFVHAYPDCRQCAG